MYIGNINLLAYSLLIASTPEPATGFLVTEGHDYLITEDGDRYITEN